MKLYTFPYTYSLRELSRGNYINRIILLVLIFFSSSNYSYSQIPTTGLVAYYPFNGNANDESGNGNNGTNNGATLTADRFGNASSAYSFDGISNHIQVPSATSLNPTNQITISTWVNPKGFYSGSSYGNFIVSKGSDATIGHYNLIYITDTKQFLFTIRFSDEVGVLPSQVLSSTIINLSTWYHVVGTYDGLTMKIFVNGVYENQKSKSLSLPNNTEDIYIGKHSNVSYPYWINGKIDDICIYNRALSASEVDALYHEGGYAQVTDYDGNTYETVQIGTQTWMKQNLKVTHYRNGDAIPNVTDNTAWTALTTGAYCNYSNDVATADIYGKLYNYYTVVDNRNLCPAGWHVPSDAEWTTLETYLGGSNVAGGKLKEIGTTHWVSPNTGADNTSGFTALPGGIRNHDDGTYHANGGLGFWWSTTENSANTAWYCYLSTSDGFSKRYYDRGKSGGFSVRCLKNDNQPPTIISFTPTSGPIGTTVTITGTNFSTTPASNNVWFGAVKATVTASTATSLSMTVPAGATYQPITVTVNGLTAYSSKPFNITFPSSGVINATSFASTVDFAIGTGPRNIAVGDIDGDGKSDIAITNWNSNTVSVYRNTSASGSITTSSFAAKVDLTTGTYPFGVVISDIDGDGKPDLIVASDDNNVSIYRNISTLGSISESSFAAKVNFEGSGYVAIRDIDGDGKPEIVSSNWGSNTISILRNTSTAGSIVSGSFDTKVDFTTGENPRCIAIEDIDGDGKPDLAVTNEGSNTVSVFRNTSTFGSINAGSLGNKVDFITGSIPHYVAIGDIDGDGKPDLAITNGGSNTVSVFNNTSTSGSIGTGSLSTKVDFTTGGDPRGIAISDIDGDGRPDLAIANRASLVSIFRNTISSGSISATSFTTKVDFTAGTSPHGIAIGDTDGDGKPDIVVANETSNSISVLRNTLPATAPVLPTITSFTPTSGPIGTTVTITGTNFSTTPANNIVWFGAVKATVTAATATTLSVTVPAGATYQPITVTVNGLTVYSSKPFNVTFSSSRVIDANSFAPNIAFSVGNSPTNVAIGDLDQDGKPDIVVNSSSSEISVLRNTSSLGTIGSGSFASKVNFSTGLNPFYVAIGDLDGDGKPDMAVSNAGSNSVSVLRNTSSLGSITSGSFATKVDFALGLSPHCIAIGDIDGDGKLDLIVQDNNSNLVSVLRNTSSIGSITIGSFAAKVDFATGASPENLLVGDVDGDGKLDIMVTNSGSTTVSVFRNTSTLGSIGLSSFAPKVDFETGTGPYFLSFGDLDGDGKPDLAVVNTNSLSILRNTSTLGTISSSSFASKVDFVVGTNPRYIAIGDIDGDGKPDIAVGNQGNDNVSVLKNTSASGTINSGSFANKVDFTSGTWTWGLALGDIEGDGKPEIIVTNASNGNTVSVLRNTVAPPPVPSITSFTPTTKVPESSVAITGNNFGATQGTSTIKFGTTTASVTSWNTTQIVATVPTLLPGSYAISVTTIGGTANSSAQFIVPECVKPTIRKKGSINILICQTPNATSYQWYLNDNAIANATKQFYVARDNYGNYSVQTVESNGCSFRSDAISIITSSAVSVYPNPSDTELNVAFDFEQVGKITIRLVNSSGNTKRIITFNKELDSQTLLVDIKDLEKGIYFIDVEINGEKIDSQKVVIL